MRLAVICWVVAAAWTADITAAGTEIYVSVNGNDGGPGTKEKPFRTLEVARDFLRKQKKSGQITGGSTMWIAEGIHCRSNTFELAEEDSGTDQAPNIYRSAAGGEVRIVGAVRIQRESFKPVTDPAILDRLPTSARGKVLQAD